MNKSTDTQIPAWLWRWTFGAISLGWLAVLATNMVRSLHDLLIIVMVSFLVACAIERPVTAMERRGVRRGIATGVVLGGVVLVLGGVSVGGGAIIISQFTSLTNALPELSRSVADLLALVGINLDPSVPAAETADWIRLTVSENAGALLMQGALLLGQIAAGALIVFYLVADGPRLRRNVCSVLPSARQVAVLDVWTAAIDKAGGYLLVRGELALFATVSSWIFFVSAGIDYPIALALWVGLISQIIPAVGTYLAGALPLLVAAGQGGRAMVITIAFLVIYQHIENYILAPRIAKRVMEIHPAIGFTAALAGAYLAGAAGALIAVPIVATAQAVISASVERHQLIENALLNKVTPKKKVSTKKKSTKKKVSKSITSKARVISSTRDAAARLRRRDN